MASDTIVLFDLASRQPSTTWSLNPWKTRMLLNYKGLDYKTSWIEYPDIKPVLSPHLPDHDPAKGYTIPTIILPDGTYMTDSRVIASHLDALHPSPSLHLSSPQLASLEELMLKIMPALRGQFWAYMPQRVLNEASIPYWYETRTQRCGMQLDELVAKEGGEEGWKNAALLLQQVTQMLKEDNSGPYFLGKDVSYADFVWAGLLLMFERIGNDQFQALLKASGDAEAHLALMKGVEPWTKRNDH